MSSFFCGKLYFYFFRNTIYRVNCYSKKEKESKHHDTTIDAAW